MKAMSRRSFLKALSAAMAVAAAPAWALTKTAPPKYIRIREGDPWMDIINSAPDGATIEFDPGRYYCETTIAIDRDVTLRGNMAKVEFGESDLPGVSIRDGAVVDIQHFHFIGPRFYLAKMCPL